MRSLGHPARVPRMKNIPFTDLVAASGDSELKSYDYADGLLTISLFVPDFDTDVDVLVKTGAIKVRQPTKSSVCHRDAPNGRFIDPAQLVYLSLVVIAESLTVNEKGIFIPSSRFSDLMDETKNGLGMAYGLHRDSCKYILCCNSDRPPVIACLLNSLDDAKVVTI